MEVIISSLIQDSKEKELLDISKITNLGWHAKTDLKEGIKKTYDWYIQNHANPENNINFNSHITQY